MESPSEFEVVLLNLIDKGKGKWNWYQLEIRLSMLDVPRSPGALSVLKDMEARGLVARSVVEGSPMDAWALLPKGKTMIGIPN